MKEKVTSVSEGNLQVGVFRDGGRYYYTLPSIIRQDEADTMHTLLKRAGVVAATDAAKRRKGA